MSHVQQMLDDCDAKIQRLTELAEKLRWFQREFPHSAAAVVPAAPIAGRSKSGHGDRQTDRQTDRQSKPQANRARVKPSRSLPSKAGPLTDRILAALQAQGPISPGALALQLQADRSHVSQSVKSLAAAGRITLTGSTVNRLIHLASQTPTPAAKAPAPSAPPMTDAGIAEARDVAITRRLRAGEATFAQLLVAMPAESGLSDDERSDACRRSLRRLAIRKRVFDVGDKWRLAEP